MLMLFDTIEGIIFVYLMSDNTSRDNDGFFIVWGRNEY